MYESKIFALATLLSSTLVYNNIHIIDHQVGESERERERKHRIEVAKKMSQRDRKGWMTEK